MSKNTPKSFPGSSASTMFCGAPIGCAGFTVPIGMVSLPVKDPEATGGAEIGYGPRGSGPGGMLGEDGADGDFERRSRRPPALRAVAGVESRVEPKQTMLHRRLIEEPEAA